jgi:hypothetical protein
MHWIAKPQNAACRVDSAAAVPYNSKPRPSGSSQNSNKRGASPIPFRSTWQPPRMNKLVEHFVLPQRSLPGFDLTAEAVAAFATSEHEGRGAIYTKAEVVDFILDISGYVVGSRLHEVRVLEPSFGTGAFLLRIVDRLMEAWQRDRKGVGDPLSDLGNALVAVELHTESFEATKALIIEKLQAFSIPRCSAVKLAEMWLKNDDFLLTPLVGEFDFVIGNPPYVRQELIPGPLLNAYKAMYSTIYDRADLYVPFIERSLSVLKSSGKLGYICADRWMKNRYGSKLRAFVSRGFHLKTYVDMVGTLAFESEVDAYPAITVIVRAKAGVTRIAHRPEVSGKSLVALAKMLVKSGRPKEGSEVKEISGVVEGSNPWILESSDQLTLVRRLESQFPALEDAGCKVGIGVATGADSAFIGPFDELDVEPSRKLPLVMTRDIMSGKIQWQGYGVINPFEDAGGLVTLSHYPRLKKYLEARKAGIASRHVAQKTPANWYRTIDRIHPHLAGREKLLIPDIKGEAHVVYEDGRLYPHHNLYYVTSDSWNLLALRAVLMSGIARLFVSAYSTKMRGGFLRFQAQYLRRICIPRWEDVAPDLKKRLIAAASREDVNECNAAVFRLYQLTKQEQATLAGN